MEKVQSSRSTATIAAERMHTFRRLTVPELLWCVSSGGNQKRNILGRCDRLRSQRSKAQFWSASPRELLQTISATGNYHEWQLIFRSVGWTSKPSDLELEQLCRIAKIKHKNITKRQEKIESYLNELKQSKYIQNWIKRIKKTSSTKQIRYTIHKAQRLPSE